MNSIVCLLSFFHILRLIKARRSPGSGVEVLIFLGAIIPVGDYILRFAMGELWFQSEGFIFHSLIYQGLLWFVAGLLYWVRVRNIKTASRVLFAPAALLLYAFFTVLSTESVSFFKPFSTVVIRFDWINSGYFIPLAIIVPFWIFLKLFKVSPLNTSKLILGFLALFILSGGIIRFNITNAVKKSFPELKEFDITPVDILQTNWKVIARDKNKYSIIQYNLIEGWRGKMVEKTAVNNFKLSQNALADPMIRNLYTRSFKNPELNLRLQGEFMNIEISELESLSQLFWIEKITITKNRSGQVLDFNVKYRSIF